VRVTQDGWQAVGMAATGSVEVEFEDKQLIQVSEFIVVLYLSRNCYRQKYPLYAGAAL
jgi:hypothetical protein